MVSFIISVNDSFYLKLYFRIQRTVVPLLGLSLTQSKFTVSSMRIHLCLATKIVTRVIFVQKRCRKHVSCHLSVDSQNGLAVNGIQRVTPKSLRRENVKSREPSDLCTTLYSIFYDTGTLNFPLAFIYLFVFVCNFMGSGITSEYLACDDTE